MLCSLALSIGYEPPVANPQIIHHCSSYGRIILYLPKFLLLLETISPISHVSPIFNGSIFSLGFSTQIFIHFRFSEIISVRPSILHFTLQKRMEKSSNGNDFNRQVKKQIILDEQRTAIAFHING